MASLQPEPEYSIAAVSKLTGASCHALRVWERRYGFPIPERSASGHRRYTRDQVRVLQAIAALAHTGRAIGELIAEFRTGRLRLPEPSSASNLPESEAAATTLVDRLLAAESTASEELYQRITEKMEPTDIVTRVLGPSWVDVGERWFRRECAVYQERVASEFLQRKLLALIDTARLLNQQPQRTIIVGTVQGDRHYGGVLMVCLFMERAGWRAVNLGVDLPVREFSAAVKRWKPNALALSFVLSRNIKKRFQELREIRDLPIFVGGRSILNYQGLARRHGLIPLLGAINTAVPQLIVECEQRSTASPTEPEPRL